MPGTFIISVDFEIHWGVYDTKSLTRYGANLRGVREAIPRMLELFDKYDIQTTFATVGMLFYKDKETLLNSLPKRLPGYENTSLNPYIGIENLLGKDEATDPYHYGRSILELISKSGIHEIGSHTFCHFYCLEKGQTIFEFEEDLAAFAKAAGTLGIQPTSLVFPRNQLRYNYLRSLKKFGYTCYRGNENSWVYKPHVKRQENLFRRGFRFLDAYFNLTGEHLHDEADLIKDYPFNIKASRFFRPYKLLLAPLEPLKLTRIRNSMHTAANQNKLFHLWWHPHNFGVNIDKNLQSLETVLKEYQKLKQSHDFRNFTMSGYADYLKSHYHVGA